MSLSLISLSLFFSLCVCLCLSLSLIITYLLIAWTTGPVGTRSMDIGKSFSFSLCLCLSVTDSLIVCPTILWTTGPVETMSMDIGKSLFRWFYFLVFLSLSAGLENLSLFLFSFVYIVFPGLFLLLQYLSYVILSVMVSLSVYVCLHTSVSVCRSQFL